MPLLGRGIGSVVTCAYHRRHLHRHRRPLRPRRPRSGHRRHRRHLHRRGRPTLRTAKRFKHAPTTNSWAGANMKKGPSSSVISVMGWIMITVHVAPPNATKMGTHTAAMPNANSVANLPTQSHLRRRRHLVYPGTGCSNFAVAGGRRPIILMVGVRGSNGCRRKCIVTSTTPKNITIARAQRPPGWGGAVKKSAAAVTT